MQHLYLPFDEQYHILIDFRYGGGPGQKSFLINHMVLGFGKVCALDRQRLCLSCQVGDHHGMVLPIGGSQHIQILGVAVGLHLLSQLIAGIECHQGVIAVDGLMGNGIEQGTVGSCVGAHIIDAADLRIAVLQRA